MPSYFTPAKRKTGSALPTATPPAAPASSPWWQGTTAPVQTPGWGDAVSQTGLQKPTGIFPTMPGGVPGAAPPMGNAPVQTPGWGDAVQAPGRQKTFPPELQPIIPGGVPGQGVEPVQTPGWGDAVRPPGATKPAPGSPFSGLSSPFNAFGALPSGFAPAGATGAQTLQDDFINSLSPEQSGPLRALLAQGVPFQQAYRMTIPR